MNNQRCETCKWRQERPVEADTNGNCYYPCLYPLPFYLPRFNTKLELGKDCLTWEAKVTTQTGGEQ